MMFEPVEFEAFTTADFMQKHTVQQLKELVNATGLLSRSMVKGMRKENLAEWLERYCKLATREANRSAATFMEEASDVVAKVAGLEDRLEEHVAALAEAKGLCARYRAYNDMNNAKILTLAVELARLTNKTAANQSWLVYMLHDCKVWSALDLEQRQAVLSNIDDSKMRDFIQKFGGATTVQPFGRTSM